jgi:signal transduction histidine kinase
VAGRTVADRFEFSIATRLPTSRQETFAAVVVCTLLIGSVAMAPFGNAQLPRSDGFVPMVEAIIFVTELTTAVLLFSQYANVGSRDLLVLADGYLFSALLVIPHILSYPGALAPRGLISSGLQTTPWLYTFWHFGFSASVVLYACLKKGAQRDTVIEPTFRPVYWNVAAIAALVCALSWFATAGEKLLPRLVADDVRFLPAAHYATAVSMATSLLALVLLWLRRKTMLDLWVLVATVATVLEQTVVALFISSRFSVGFYVSRFFSVAVSTIVLIVLLSETVALYARLSRAIWTLQRERGNKLMNLEAAVAAMAHEVKQPLTGIATKSAAARRFLSRDPPDIARVQLIVDEVTSACFRTNEVIESVRALFRSSDHELRPVNVNDVVLEALQMLRDEFADHGIMLSTSLTPDLPFVVGHKGQLLEVILNLSQNAIDAMASVAHRGGRFRVETELRGLKDVVISVEDSGPGIAPDGAANIFDAFVTTKTKGMGLGLAIAQMIVERHHGQIFLTSGAGSGARFQITLPIGALVATQAAAE